MDRYAFLLLSMSLQDAKAILGLPADVQPTPAAIKDAWKAKAFENHPDRGGDPAKMVEINVAKDILEGKQRPTYDRSAPSPAPSPGPSPYGGGGGGGGQRWEPPKPIKVDFNEAKSKAGIPGGVEWKFVTDRQRGKSYSSDEYYRSEGFWVAYGRTETKHIFVGIWHQIYEQNFVGGAASKDIWEMGFITRPLTGSEGTEPAWLFGQVSQALKLAGFDGKFNAKVVDAKGWTFSEKFPQGGATSIKNWLAGSGEVSEDDPRVQNRKAVVELKYTTSYKEAAHHFKFEYGRPPNQFTKDFEAIEVIVNGKASYLGEADAKRFLTSTFKGHHLLDLIFGDQYYGGSKKTLTRAKAGKAVMKWLSENATSLGDDVRKTLMAASEQMK